MKRDIRNTGLIFGLVFFFAIAGCATINVFSVHYEPEGPPAFAIPPDRKLTLFLGPVKGDDSRLWYRVGEYEWFLERSPNLIVYDALARELGRMGITVTKSPSEGQGSLEVEIRWFGPYGYNPSAAAVILCLSLYAKGATEPLWRDKIEAGGFPHTSAWTIRGKISSVEKTLSEALSNTVRQLGWRAGFQKAVAYLLGNSDSVVAGEQ
jgi:hypothetical protein